MFVPFDGFFCNVSEHHELEDEVSALQVDDHVLVRASVTHKLLCDVICTYQLKIKSQEKQSTPVIG